MNYHFWITTKIFVAVILTVAISQYIVFGILPFSMHETKAIEDKTIPSNSLPATPSKEGTALFQLLLKEVKILAKDTYHGSEDIQFLDPLASKAILRFWQE